ncbi:PREDICTED: EF-hand calcium-binding domain-containing protein 7-like isoform X2 [Priapulus caudatus]|uniref:EF-hand calcium-binding domain-containing protein 7-like isoform X2 n=1 Tax=Priapulus caudatus TaxID=37621 RepID=A0ABM1EDF2_PRICU|nr:PREDICTED: EF-hand calcium-binding domain-containing protein 7-like isoform X2 [Priapulus caudatus]
MCLSGTVSFNKFCSIVRSEAPMSENQLINAFRKIDVNHDGFISHEEFLSVMTTKGELMSPSEVRGIFRKADINKYGKLDYKEFCKIILKTVEQCQSVAVERMNDMQTKRARHQSGESHSSAVSQDSTVTLGKKTPEPKPRRLKRTEINVQDIKKAAVAKLKTKVSKPSNLQDWYHHKSKGIFYLEEDSTVVNHHYILKLPRSSSVWMTIEPYSPTAETGEKTHPTIDTALYILRLDGEHASTLVTCTEKRDKKGVYYVRVDLDSGKYLLLPFTTGCRLRPRLRQPHTESRLVRKDKEKVQLTKAFRQALTEIFDMCDQDDNGLLSREEFSYFNLRTSGEELADDEWTVVEENVALQMGELTQQGFIALHQMEAEDNEGNTEDLWVTLNTIGYNKNLQLDEACPFKLNVYLDECKGELVTNGSLTTDLRLEEAICQFANTRGSHQVLNSDDSVALLTYMCDTRVTLVVHNKSSQTVTVHLDCSESTNCVSNHSSLKHQITVPRNNFKIGMHLMPEDENSEWNINTACRIVGP